MANYYRKGKLIKLPDDESLLLTIYIRTANSFEDECEYCSFGNRDAYGFEWIESDVREFWLAKKRADKVWVDEDGENVLVYN